MEKYCCRCSITKNISEFNKCKSGRMGLHNHCRTCQKEVRRTWYLNNSSSERQKSSEYSKSELGAISRKKRYEKNKEEILEKNRVSRRTESAREKARAARKRLRETSPSFKMACSLRGRLRQAVIKQKTCKCDSMLNLLGCSVEELKLHIESKFTDGMNWDNYGTYGWHIDHIIPCSSFDLTKEEEQRKCFHYTNLQPLWWRDNMSKGGKRA